MNTKKKRAPRKVDFFANKEDFEAGYLALMGQTISSSSEKTHLTKGQIAYRCRKLLGINRSDFRNGRGQIAQMVLARTRPFVEPIYQAYLETRLP